MPLHKDAATFHASRALANRRGIMSAVGFEA